MSEISLKKQKDPEFRSEEVSQEPVLKQAEFAPLQQDTQVPLQQTTEAPQQQTDATKQHTTEVKEEKPLTEEEKAERKRQRELNRYGEDFIEFSTEVSAPYQRKMRLVHAYEKDAIDSYQMGKIDFDEGVTEEKETLEKKKKLDDHEKKKLNCLTKLSDYRTMVEGKLTVLQNLYRDKVKPDALAALEKSTDKDETSGHYIKKIYDLTTLFAKVGESLGTLGLIMKQDLSDEDYDFFAQLLDKDFIWGASDEDDFDKLMAAEQCRATTLLSMLKGDAVMDTNRYVLKKPYVESLFNRIKLEEGVEGAAKKLDWQGPTDPIKICDAIKPPQEEKINEVTQWQTDVLLSTRFHAATLSTLFSKLPEDINSGDPAAVQKQKLLSMFSNMSGVLFNVSNDYSALSEAASKKKGAKPEELYGDAVEMSRRMGHIFGHMKDVYYTLQKKLDETPDFDFKKAQELLEYMYQAFSQKRDKPKDLKAAAEQVMKYTEDADLMLKNADAFLADTEYVPTDEYGVEYGDLDKFFYDGLNYEDNAEKTVTELKRVRAINAEFAEKKTLTAASINTIKEQLKEAEAEKQRLLDEKKAIEDAEKNKTYADDDTVKIRFVKAKESEYIPRSALGKIKTFNDYNGEKVEGVGKMKAFFSRKKMTGAQIKERMNKHVRLFMSNKDGLTFNKMSQMASVVLEGSDVINRYTSQQNLEADDTKAFEYIARLKDAQNGDEINGILLDVISSKLLPSMVDESKELKLDSQYLKDHPAAAKIVLMHKLMAHLKCTGRTDVEGDFKERVDAASGNVDLLYNAIVSSEEYKSAMHQQRLAVINQKLANQGATIENLEKKIDSYIPQANLTDYSERLEKDAERFKSMVDGVTGASLKLSEQYAKHQDLMKIDISTEELDKRIVMLEKSIEESRRKALAIKQKPAFAPKQEVRQVMGHGAVERMSTILDLKVFKDLTLKPEVKTEIKNLMVEAMEVQLPYVMGKGVTDLKQLTTAELDFFATSMVERINSETKLGEYLTSDKVGYREYLITNLIRKQSYVSPDEFENLRKQLDKTIDEDATAILANCPAYQKENQGHLQITKLEYSKAGCIKIGMRGDRRLARISRLKPFLAEILQASGRVDMIPKSIYEFREERLHMKLATEDQPVESFLDDYKAYLDKLFKTIADSLRGQKKKQMSPMESRVYARKLALSQDFLDQTWDSWEEIKNYILENYSEYGIGHDTEELLETLEDSLNQLGNTDYQKALSKIEAGYMDKLRACEAGGNKLTEDEKRAMARELYTKDKDTCRGVFEKVRQIRSGDQEYPPEKITAINSRITQFNALGNGSLSYLLPVLLEDRDFKKHLFTDDDTDYEIFLAEKIPLLDGLTTEIRKHVYVDQYLLEKKQEIRDYIMGREGKAQPKELLQLDQLDAEINGKELMIRGIDGKKKKTTFDQIVRDLVTGGKGDVSQEDRKKYGSFFMELLLNGGADVILDETFLKQRKAAFDANYNALTRRLDTILKLDNPQITWPKDRQGEDIPDEEEKKKVLEAFRVSFLHNERRNLIYSRSDAFVGNLIQRLDEDLKVMVDAYATNQQMILQNEVKKSFASTIVDHKKAGRAAYEKYFSDTEKDFETYVKDEQRAKVSKEAYKDKIKKYTEDAGKNLTDEFLGSIYSTVLKRMVVHGAADQEEEFKKDEFILLHSRAFMAAADEYLSESKIVDEAEVKSLKKGLFEVYGEMILQGHGTDGSTDDTIGFYKKKMQEFFAQVDGGIGAARYIVDDNAGVSSIDYRQGKGESATSFAGREPFYQELYKKLDDKDLQQEISSLGANEQILLAHVLSEQTGIAALRGFIEEITVDKERSDAFDVGADSCAMNYLNNTTITGLMGADYQALLTQLSQSSDLKTAVTEALSVVKTCMDTKAYQSQFLEAGKSDLQSIQQLKFAMDETYQASIAYIKDLGGDNLLPAHDKFWRLYTVMRAYDDVFNTYDEKVKSKKIIPDPRFNDLLHGYGFLQEYFSYGDKEEGSHTKLFTIPLAKHLGIVDKKKYDACKSDEERQTLALSVAKDEDTRLAMAKEFRAELFEKTGTMTTRTEQIYDEEEKHYPENVVRAVKQIDQWIAKNALYWKGNSEANFGMEILGHPIRERLFVYYAIEKDRMTMPTGLDAALSINGYIPNLEVFSDKMKTTASFVWKKVDGLKQKKLVRKMGFMDSYGEVALDKLENAIHLLDKNGTDAGAYLKRLSTERTVATDQTMPESVRVREVCYFEFLNEVGRSRDLVKGKKEEEAKEDPKVKRQAERVKNALRRLMRANETVAEEFEGFEIHDEEVEFKKTIDTTRYHNEDGGTADTVNSVVAGVTGAAQGTMGLASKLQKIEVGPITFKPWTLSNKQLTNIFISDSVFYSVTALTSIVSVILTTKNGMDGHKSNSAILGAAADGFVSGTDLMETALEVTDFLFNVGEEATEKLTSAATGGMQAVAGFVNLGVAAYQHHTVSKSEEGALQFADKIQQDAIQKQKQEGDRPEIPLKDALSNVAAMQKRTAKASEVSNTLKACGGMASLIGAVVPGGQAIGSAVSTLFSVANAIFTFWAKKDQREKTVDEFIGMDSLLEKFMAKYETFSEDLKQKYGDKSDIRKKLRMQALQDLHFPSMEEFFADISTRYATLIYRHIFFDTDGKQILADNTAAIEERSALLGLFPDLKFGYPTREGDWPKPTIEEMTQSLMREP